ncbi:tRNA (adenosine(37)-N6)-dimethylallyltransferase MiaA [Haloflavibacter putidus]|uniref:tRNA dimethylallyltransferase n=1 Tax=Haloflavibacter putidus TaxID=2576776 RepID=A0A508A0K5_9FLAO|nr:tRNA (adenosine(37)-N6)-dimethylallyltransferase MiaA [Haloflavibacter putidus]TQD39362.1 tRNA (adenosine(37)-N6)-dimethylallyltransferase MiaA [Haloflavibacter putidus]
MKSNFLIPVVGPTAIGKTAVAIKLAKHFSSEIVSADSRQFYKEMQIGTAVPSKEELAQVKHHFIQHLSVEQNYSVGNFEKDALRKLERLFKTYSHIFLVGGSGLYVDAVTKGLDYFPPVSPNIRKELNKIFEENGLEELVEELKVKDPEFSEKADLQNPQRVIRALEICRGTDKNFSYYRNKPKPTRDFSSVKIGLTAPRELIYERIEQRVDKMMAEGLLQEAEKMFAYRDRNALNTVGYKELFLYLDGQLSLEKAVEEIKKNTRRFAKRQLTWFRKDKEIKWFAHNTPISEIRAYILQKSSPRQ